MFYTNKIFNLFNKQKIFNLKYDKPPKVDLSNDEY